MSRTHFPQTVSIADGGNTRKYAAGAVIGNYVTIRLVSRTVVGAGQATPLLVDRIPMPMPFRVSQVGFDAIGTTAVANLRVSYTDHAGVTTDISAATVVSSGTPKVVTPGNLVQTARDIPIAACLDLYADTDGAGAIPAGTAVAWVTGYFTEHMFIQTPAAVRGQSKLTSGHAPVAGFYDVWPLVNERVNAAQAARTECSFLAPYKGRVEAVVIDGRNLTITTGTITADVQKNAVSLFSAALDADVNAQNASFIIDVDSTPSLAAGQRDVAKGDTITLVISSGAADSVPLNAIEAHVWVWCKGHVRNMSTEPTVED